MIVSPALLVVGLYTTFMDTLICSVPGCDFIPKRIVKGMCIRHYERLRVTGNVGAPTKISDSHGFCYKPNCGDKAGPTGACRKHWHNKNSPNKHRNRSLRLKGLTQEKYDEILKGQNNGCKICGVTEPGHQRKNFAIDHDHSCCPNTEKHCGKCFRGLLCTRCNLVLGEVQDDPKLLQKMIEYLTAPTPADV